MAPPPTVAPVRGGSIALWAITNSPYSRPVGRLSCDRIHDSSHSDEEPFLDLDIPSDVHHAAALGAGGALPGGAGRYAPSLACYALPKAAMRVLS